MTPPDLLPVLSAARKVKRTRQAVYSLINRGKIRRWIVDGRVRVSLAQLRAYLRNPDKGGRPPKLTKEERERA